MKVVSQRLVAFFQFSAEGSIACDFAAVHVRQIIWHWTFVGKSNMMISKTWHAQPDVNSPTWHVALSKRAAHPCMTLMQYGT